ncbi:c-type cytochrome [Fodinibius sp. AD559]|uniref:c-type cytochrome n=1 Tax=Fodinibius sp. AD559 TaxID=3424179 RepID=UPI004046D18E
MKNILLLSLLASFTFVSCHMGDSSHMSQSHQRQIQSTFDSLQKSYKMVLETYEQDSTSMPNEMKTLYSQMQQMHDQMDKNHRHMMTNHKQQSMHQGDERGMMRSNMRIQAQNKMTGEWYNQMRDMHQQMGRMHQDMGHNNLAEKHKQLAERFKEISGMVPESDDENNQPKNEEGDPSLLNGANLYATNCASCHGQNAQGVGNVFPPLVNSKWVTGDKSIPVRIIRDGLQGSIEVNGKTYEGNMPAFKARLSVAEIAAIVNYLREKSEGDHADITQDDVIEIANTYSNRSMPWQPEELLSK